jgi:hypothetical protein
MRRVPQRADHLGPSEPRHRLHPHPRVASPVRGTSERAAAQSPATHAAVVKNSRALPTGRHRWLRALTWPTTPMEAGVATDRSREERVVRPIGPQLLDRPGRSVLGQRHRSDFSQLWASRLRGSPRDAGRSGLPTTPTRAADRLPIPGRRHRGGAAPRPAMNRSHSTTRRPRFLEILESAPRQPTVALAIRPRE